MTFLRSVGVPELVGLFGTLVSKVPLPLQAVLVPLLTQLPLSLCNMICTNVPGPQMPLYLLGHKLLRCYPYVPIGGELGVNVAILSYDGTAYFGFGGDVHAVPDIDRFEDLLRESFQELRAAAAATQPYEDASETPVSDKGTPKPTRSRRATLEKLGPKPKVRTASPVKRATPKRHSAAKASAIPFLPTASPSMANAETAQAGD
jgi:diacylglycerol O-acyltransferase / wax synthase